jgi:hypothetical protein
MWAREALARAESECETHYAALLRGGCEQEIALERTWDALRQAFGDGHCYDPRERMLELRIRETLKEGNNS